MLLTIQPDLVRKDMRHETRLFFYRITMDTPLDELRDGGHGFCPQRVESMVQGIFIPFVVDPQTFPEYAHLITPIGLVYNVSFLESGSRFKPVGVDYFRQLVAVETIAVVVFTQHKAHHMLLPVQPDLVRKDMRHETRLFLYGITIDIPLDELRDGGPERASNASYPWESVLVMPLGVTCPPASIPIHGGHPLGESLPRPYLDSFP